MAAKEKKAIAVGIDLGTTFSAICYINEKGQPVPERCILVFPLTKIGRLRGAMLNNGVLPIQKSRSSMKRFIGKKRRDDRIQSSKWPFEILEDKNKNLIFPVYGEIMYPEQISAIVLSRLKTRAEEYKGCSITEAVITVPAKFNDNQRMATQRAAEIAGFKVLTILNEPTAAAIAYGHNSIDSNSDEKRTILVYDLGGGTFDVSIVKMEGDSKAVVLASEGLMNVGGDDFDKLMFEEVKEQIIDENKTIMDEWEVLKKCREAKATLSNVESADIIVTVMPNYEHKVISFTRKLFNELCGKRIDETMVCVKDALRKANLSKDDIDEVVMVGGSSRIPYARDMIKKFFPTKTLRNDTNIDETVAMGAALMANSLCGGGTRIQLEDIVPLSIGIKGDNGIFHPVVPAYSKRGVEHKIKLRYVTNEQHRISLKIYQGDAKTVTNNNFIKEMAVELNPDAPGTHILHATFVVQSNGTLKVLAELQQSTIIVPVLEVTDMKHDQRDIAMMRDRHIRRLARDQTEFERRRDKQSNTAEINSELEKEYGGHPQQEMTEKRRSNSYSSIDPYPQPIQSVNQQNLQQANGRPRNGFIYRTVPVMEPLEFFVQHLAPSQTPFVQRGPECQCSNCLRRYQSRGYPSSPCSRSGIRRGHHE